MAEPGRRRHASSTVRDQRLYRFGRGGERLGAPVETVPVDNTNFIGPLAPQVSPDGSMVAYHYFNTGVLSDRTRTSVAYTRSDVGTEPGVFGGALGGYLTPSWTADGRVLVFYGAQRTSHVGIDTPGAATSTGSAIPRWRRCSPTASSRARATGSSRSETRTTCASTTRERRPRCAA